VGGDPPAEETSTTFAFTMPAKIYEDTLFTEKIPTPELPINGDPPAEETSTTFAFTMPAPIYEDTLFTEKIPTPELPVDGAVTSTRTIAYYPRIFTRLV
jgi:hypothetical protein